MRAATRKLATEEQFYAAALRALARRAYSVHDMRQTLERRLPGEAETGAKMAVERVLLRLKGEQLLDDARYARQFANHRAESRRQGRFRIARELRARGVPDRHIEAALEETFREADEAAVIRQRIERRLRQLGARGAPSRLDNRKLASLYRSLLRAGFSAEAIRAELRALARRSIPEAGDRTSRDEQP